MTPQERARRLVHPQIANVRQYRGSGSLDMGRIHTVTRWVGDQLERERLARIAAQKPPAGGFAPGSAARLSAPVPARRVCGRYGCDRPAVHVIRCSYNLPVFRCATHAGEAYDVYGKFANRQSDGASMAPAAEATEPLRPETHPDSTLNWGKGFHWNYRPHRCIACGQPTLLKNDDGDACHKVCAEAAS